MQLISLADSGSTTQKILLAPESAMPSQFRNVIVDSTVHRERLAEAQRLRGRIALDEGAVRPWQLSPDGRHIQEADHRSWHLLTLNADGRVAACVRYLPHGHDIGFHDLAVARTSLAQSKRWGSALRAAVEADLLAAKRRGCSYVELGGWVISEALRCTREVLRTIGAAYAFSQLLGGALGITTASTRRCSAAILRRIGGQRLRDFGTEAPAYYDDHYNCEMEVLRFDSSRPAPRYRSWIDSCRSHIEQVPVICRATASAAEALPIRCYSMPFYKIAIPRAAAC